ncbi:hypothetical protein PV327_008824 [Microctonus hyperodae]|uniref:Uncharacterized protein n=1 Tax=Microctonus hyperodae TaxID=165561 RepID=A0AA39FTK0_MICHY|nr:hypothetical protein PV327_008824 [Microctonus hyperodae]
MFETTLTHALTKSGDDLISARANGKFYEAVPVTVIRAENYYSDIDLLEFKERLEWSQNSMNQFEAFFRENPHRVFLRNKPRSLLSPGPHVLITPDAQCRCLGYDYYRKGPTRSSQRISMDECTEPLQLKHGLQLHWRIPIAGLLGRAVCTYNGMNRRLKYEESYDTKYRKY